METSRRDFLKVATLGGAAATVFGFDLRPAYAQLRELKIARATETRSTCPYCSVSCGVIIYTLGDKAKNVTPQVIHVEGDPDHPDQSRHALSQGLVARAGHSESAPPAQAAGAPPRLRPIGRTFPGTRRSTRSRHWVKKIARRHVRREGRARATRSTAAKASPSPAAAPTPTSSTIWS